VTGWEPVARVPVSRARIVRAATAIVDAHGVDALSMRGLATELGVTAMALYRHVGGRDELLVAVLDEISERIVHPDLPADPVERAVTVLVALRAFLVEHPWVLRLIVGGQWSSLRGLWFQDAVLAAGRDAGLDDAGAVACYTSLWQMTVGEVEFETSRLTGPPGPGWAAALDGAREDELRTVRELAPRWKDLAVPFEARLRRVVAALYR
jgi:AcrR family transcriptional regulator